jgi:Endonuclease/Exonuclease/phosphatase family
VAEAVVENFRFQIFDFDQNPQIANPSDLLLYGLYRLLTPDLQTWYMAHKLIILLFLAVLFQPSSGQEFTVMFYNVENLFDTTDDTTRNDDEFLPEGSRRWTGNRYHKKINALSQVIAAAGEWELPALVGLCEVENEEVVKDLAYGTILSAGNYGIVHRDSPDPRGIDLALLYRRDHFRIAEVRSWIPSRAADAPFESRNLLYVKAEMGIDTLHVILCHFPSRRGGLLAAEHGRKEMAMLVRAKTDSILTSSERATVIVMGDFNAGPKDEIILNLTNGEHLVNTAVNLASTEMGSYKYQGTWEVIDQILLSPALAEGSGPIKAVLESVRVLDEPFLMTDDPSYPGKKPHATYAGFRWAGGYSDHLPVLITLFRR